MMDDHERNQMLFQQAIDQFGAQLRDIAPHLGVYYFGLIAGGLPAGVAAAMTMDAQNALLDLMLAPRPQQEGR
jgi:hypothetical protein